MTVVRGPENDNGEVLFREFNRINNNLYGLTYRQLEMLLNYVITRRHECTTENFEAYLYFTDLMLRTEVAMEWKKWQK